MNIENKIINTLRVLSVDMIENAKSGHPGAALGCAPMMFVLFCKIMILNPSNPLLFNRDRFVLSNGHCCALLYSILYLLGYNYDMNDLKNFRQLDSKTPGHPELNQSLGIEISTGPLGQGIANGVGMAISSKKLGLKNKIYVMCGDGCLMEGVSYESTSLAGHLGLNNLILLYDSNKITIDGSTDITFTENTRDRFLALNWNVLEVKNGDTDIDDIYNKLLIANESINKPTIIFINTTIGYGSIFAGENKIHGAPLGINNTINLKKKFNFNENNKFFIDDEIKEYFRLLKEKKINDSLKINDFNITFSNNIEKILNDFKQIKMSINYATRESSNFCLNILANNIDNIIIGSADLAESNKTLVTNKIINKSNFNGKYLHYGIREHAMCSIANGISTFGIIPIVSTFLVFITYCLAPIRMAALSKHKIIYIFTHDSVLLGEDGPTHQPIESLTILRSIPNLLTIRPCDTREVCGAYKIALENNGPTALIFTRQILPNIENSNSDKIKYGAYIVYETSKKIDLIIISTGSEISLALDTIKFLEKENNLSTRLISMPCTELYDIQAEDYKEKILPKNIQKYSIEAGSTMGWYKYADYVYGIDRFGESGKIDDLKEKFGLNIEKISSFILNILNKSSK